MSDETELMEKFKSGMKRYDDLLEDIQRTEANIQRQQASLNEKKIHLQETLNLLAGCVKEATPRIACSIDGGKIGVVSLREKNVAIDLFKKDGFLQVGIFYPSEPSRRIQTNDE